MIELNGTYNIDGTEFENPTIEIWGDGLEISASSMSINVTVKFSKIGVNKGVRLENVAVNNLNYDGETLAQRVVEHIDANYKI